MWQIYTIHTYGQAFWKGKPGKFSKNVTTWPWAWPLCSMSNKSLFTLLWILSVPKIPCYELGGINQSNWVCKCRIKAKFKLFSAQHFFENSILFIFSNKQLFFFTTFHVHQVASGYPFSIAVSLTRLWSDEDHQARPPCHSPASLTLRWSHSIPATAPRVEAALTGPRPPDPRQGTSGISRGHEDRAHLASRHHGKSTLHRTKNTMEISFYWSWCWDQVITERITLMSQTLSILGPRVIVKYFNTTLGTKTFLPKKVNKHKSFSVL